MASKERTRGKELIIWLEQKAPVIENLDLQSASTVLDVYAEGLAQAVGQGIIEPPMYLEHAKWEVGLQNDLFNKLSKEVWNLDERQKILDQCTKIASDELNKLRRETFDPDTEIQKVRFEWKRSGLSKPEIRETVLVSLERLGILTLNNLRFLSLSFMSSRLTLSSHELKEAVEVLSQNVDSGDFPKEYVIDLIHELADSSGELNGRMSIDYAKDASIHGQLVGDLQYKKLTASEFDSFYDSQVGQKLRVWGVLKWFSNEDDNPSLGSKFQTLFREIFKPERDNPDYLLYCQNSRKYIWQQLQNNT
ncbi:MAG: hypothetical protein AAB546_00180 [Patescibacteria group bacterium]